MKCGINELFSIFNKTVSDNQENYFSFIDETPCPSRIYKQDDIDFISAYFTRGFNISLLEGDARSLFELSFNAFDIFLHAWLSELPVEKETIAFGRKIIDAAKIPCNIKEKRSAAQRALNDRGDINTLTVLNASGKVSHEVHRMMGLLRFSPDKKGDFTAICEPDTLILPALGEYFTSRFGETPWSIIDVKRKLCLRRKRKEKAKTHVIENIIDPAQCKTDDEWEELWKHYHKTINNEDRNNPGLQRQFMPKRYWKYLSEMKNG